MFWEIEKILLFRFMFSVSVFRPTDISTESTGFFTEGSSNIYRYNYVISNKSKQFRFI